MIIDRTPNGTNFSHEDPMRIRLKKIADGRVQVPSQELIIKKIKEKLENRVISTQISKA